MRLHAGCFFVCFALGCHAVPRPTSQPQSLVQNSYPAQAIAPAEESRAAEPSPSDLSLAAACLEAGNPAAACQHLARFLGRHPEQTIVRMQFAELLLRLGRVAEARGEFERFVTEAAEGNDIEVRRRVHAYGRLMQLAEQEDDGYGVCLNRGIGLFLLACNRAELDEPAGDLPVEGLLCKAAAELSLAHDSKPEEPRPCWYLYLVWQRLGQQQLAERWLRQAAEAPPLSLPPSELRSLYLVLSYRLTRKGV